MFPSHWYVLVSDPFFTDLFGKKYVVESLIICTFMGIGIFALALSILTNHPSLFIVISLIFQLISVCVSLSSLAFVVEPSRYHEYLIKAVTNYSGLDHKQYEIQNQCHGVKLIGCDTVCCDYRIQSDLKNIFRSNFRWFYVLPNSWLIILSLLLPSLILFWHFSSKKMI